MEPYPSRKVMTRFLDQIVLTVGVVGPLTSVPQLLKIYWLQDATGVSTMAWLLPAIFDIPWIVYGIVHKERPIIVAYSLWFIVNFSVAVGAVMYGAGIF